MQGVEAAHDIGRGSRKSPGKLQGNLTSAAHHTLDTQCPDKRGELAMWEWFQRVGGSGKRHNEVRDTYTSHSLPYLPLMHSGAT